MKVYITNIQRFCLNDGPGIRTTVFMKGCNLHCPWCANPETMGSCHAQENDDWGETGEWESAELAEELRKDEIYFCNGGVTFSGGEPLLQMDSLTETMKSLGNKNIHICMETALYAGADQIRQAIRYVNLFIVDIKMLIPEKSRDILGGEVKQYLQNLELLIEHGCETLLRIPLVKNITTDEENMKLVKQLIDRYGNSPVEVFQLHGLAEKKYEKLNLKMRHFEKLQDSEIKEIIKRLSENRKGIVNYMTI